MYAFLCFLWWVPIYSYTIYIQCVVLVCSHMYALMFLCSSDFMFLYVLMFLCSTHISCIHLNFRSSSLDLRSSKFAFSLKHYTYALSGVWAMDGPPRGPAMGVSNCCGLASIAWGCLGGRVAVEQSPWRMDLPLHDCVLSQIYASRGAPQASRGGWLRGERLVCIWNGSNGNNLRFWCSYVQMFNAHILHIWSYSLMLFDNSCACS